MTTRTGLRGKWGGVSWLLVAAGLVWLLWLLRGEGSTMVGQLVRDGWPWLGLSLLVGSVAVAHDAYIFYYLIDRPTRQRLGFLYIARLLFVGQMIRHLPGRFWGVVYQVNEASSHIAPSKLVAINVDFMLVVLAHSVLIPTVVVAALGGHGWLAGGIMLFGVALLAGMLRLPWLPFVIKRLPNRLARPLTRQLAMGEDAPAVAHHPRDIVMVLLSVISHWLFYLGAWQLFPRLFPQLTDTSPLLLCAAYTLAWVIGFLTVITPAGLGVRETAFVFFSAPLAAQADLAFLAIFVRIWLLVIDLILFAIFVTISLLHSPRIAAPR